MLRALVGLVGLGATLTSGCIVVPLNADGTPAYPIAAAPASVVIAPAAPQQIALRLYPANDVASATGVVTGAVTNYLNGRGTFTINVGGETMAGEATRSTSGSGRDGIANAYGARGSFANCRYTMNSSSQGLGSCTLSNGARYQLHIGS